ncbi:hypothetical protein THARTR1_11266 [Trichoderma harzianum]|uniref:DNA2/NAM7 helicase-like C-terminal domain-containing protein n=1 Tax=Trichoderma harzianum TaxID=5544 RepID=A0A2K0T3A5_TRIHA|nr:hypothetical protein THARTR1_11266 [Trichoderma harzianum]
MFERLAKLNSSVKTLQVQHRMIPQIQEIVQTFYPMLQDHPSVLLRPPVEGMGATPLWWYRHKHPHKLEKMSVSNLQEARVIVGFLKYLIASRINPHKVTILACYSAQTSGLRISQ